MAASLEFLEEFDFTKYEPKMQDSKAKDKKTKQEAAISKEQVEESTAVGSISKRSFVVPFAPMFYLFQKKGLDSSAGK